MSNTPPPTGTFGSIVNTIETIWQILNSQDNDPIVVALMFGWAALIISHIVVFFSHRKVLAEKDKRIEDLVDTRNFFQEIIAKQEGIKRLTSKKTGKKTKKKK